MFHSLFDTLQEVVASTAEAVRPAERLTVSQAAEVYRKLNNPGSYVGPWRNATTPYLVEPQDVLTSVSHRAMIFAGPAQTGKTDMFLNWAAYTIRCDPADMMLIEKAQATARDFSIRRVDRLHRHSPEIGERLIQRRNSDNTFDKKYSSGMLMNLSWPSINELSGRPVPRLWLTDYDRMSQDVDGEGAPFDLARKRATSFQSHGMCAAESSPGFINDNPRWIAKSRHEAPPTQGILALYNRGDRRRWYWKCVNPSCRNAFEPDFSLLRWPNSEDPVEAAEMVTMQCPHCFMDYSHDSGGNMPGKTQLNIDGRWVKDGMLWTPEGEVVGKPVRSDIASFWMKGPAAAFTSWKELVTKFLAASKEYEDTGSEQALKTTVNTDQGLPYTPKAQAEARSPETLKSRARDYGDKMVPHGVRFLVACIDVQKRRFVVQVHGFGVGGDIWVVDRFDIRKSRRIDDDGDRWPVDPAAYPEDWKLLMEEVMMKSYPLIDGSERRMSIKLTLCDSGGREGVTTNAYNFVRWLRHGRELEPVDGGTMDQGEYEWQDGMLPRFQLIKGEPKPNVPRVHLGFPDSQRKDRHAGARGEIPVLFLNSNSLKDTVNGMLDRTEARGGRVNFPSWLPDGFFTELTVETRDPVKGWQNLRNYRNESWDLLVYAYASTLTRQIGMEFIDWDQPPSWAAPWDTNDLVFDPVKQHKPFMAESRSSDVDFAALAESLA